MTVERPTDSRLKERLLEQARTLGFDAAGVASAEPLAEVERLAAWLDRGFHGSMGFMRKRLAERGDPSRLLPGTRSVLMVLKSYWTPQYEELVRRGSDPHDCLVAFYALGRDYHEVLNDGLAQLEETCRVAGFATRTFVDSSPVMEKALAVRAGLGVRGRNSLLINPEFGSWVVLGGMLTTATLEPDAPLEREGEGLTGCGPCRLCLEACPTAAIREPGVIDSRRCLAYLTIEAGGGAGQGLCLEGKPPYVYGCDECQIVCPKNRNVRVGSPARFGPARARRAYAPEALRAMGPEEFEAEFGHSTVRRIGLDRFQRNVVRCRP